MQKIKSTTRKFYNKWHYKLSFAIKGISGIRYKSIVEVVARSGRPEVANLISILESQSPDSYAKRMENNILDIYTNDQQLFQTLYDEFNELLRHAYAPTDGDLLDQSKHVIVAKQLPYDRYRYKVFLSPHKITDINEKTRFIDWLGTQEPRVSITTTVKKWFIKTHWNWDRRYMYVEDEQTLLMLKMKNAAALGTVYTFSLSDK